MNIVAKLIHIWVALLVSSSQTVQFFPIRLNTTYPERATFCIYTRHFHYLPFPDSGKAMRATRRLDYSTCYRCHEDNRQPKNEFLPCAAVINVINQLVSYAYILIGRVHGCLYCDTLNIWVKFGCVYFVGRLTQDLSMRLTKIMWYFFDIYSNNKLYHRAATIIQASHLNVLNILIYSFHNSYILKLYALSML